MEIKTADEVRVGQTVRFPMADHVVNAIEPVGEHEIRFYVAGGLVQVDREQTVGILADGVDHG